MHSRRCARHRLSGQRPDVFSAFGICLLDAVCCACDPQLTLYPVQVSSNARSSGHMTTIAVLFCSGLCQTLHFGILNSAMREHDRPKYMGHPVHASTQSIPAGSHRHPRVGHSRDGQGAVPHCRRRVPLLPHRYIGHRHVGQALACSVACALMQPPKQSKCS